MVTTGVHDELKQVVSEAGGGKGGMVTSFAAWFPKMGINFVQVEEYQKKLAWETNGWLARALRIQ